MSDMHLVEWITDDAVTALLACGHRTGELHAASSTFDFPGDPVHCPECRVLRQLDVRLQAQLMATVNPDPRS